MEQRVRSSRWAGGLFALCCVLAGSGAAAFGQAMEVAPAALPDAPALVSAANAGGQETNPVAGRFDKYIGPGQMAPHLSAGDKAVLGVRDAFSPISIAVWPMVAGYEQILNGSPNWPQNVAGYFRRAGAAGIRDSSSGMFTDSVFSVVFHQDPRYYRVGPGRNVVYRTLYAITRPMITRTDAGRVAPNVSLLSGDFFGALLTNAYYPTINQGFTQNLETFGGSVGSSALGCFVAEFAEDFLEAIGVKRRQ